MNHWLDQSDLSYIDLDEYKEGFLKNTTSTGMQTLYGKVSGFEEATTLDLIREHVIGIQLDGSPLCGNYEKFAHMEANFQMSKWAIKWRVSRQMLREQGREQGREQVRWARKQEKQWATK